MDFTKGFKIESDGTPEVTKIFDSEGEHVGLLTFFQASALDRHVQVTLKRYKPDFPRGSDGEVEQIVETWPPGDEEDKEDDGA